MKGSDRIATETAASRRESPVVYAIVVNYNGWQDTADCCESLLRSDYPDLRLVVVDNASTDDSLARLEEWLTANRAHRGMVVRDGRTIDDVPDVAKAEADIVLVASGGNFGFAGGTNVGLRYMLRRDASAFALLLNNDAIIAPDAVRKMINVARRSPNAGAVGAAILRRDQPEVLEMLAGATISRATGMIRRVGADAPRAAARPETLQLDYVSGCCLLVSAETVRRIGLMDERYFLYSEDADWGVRMRRAGLRLDYCPSAEVWHKGGASVVHRSAMHDYYMVRGALMFVRKHTPSLLPVALVYWLWRGIMPKLFRRQWTRLRAASRGYRDFLMQTMLPTSPTSTSIA